MTENKTVYYSLYIQGVLVKGFQTTRSGTTKNFFIGSQCRKLLIESKIQGSSPKFEHAFLVITLSVIKSFQRYLQHAYQSKCDEITKSSRISQLFSRFLKVRILCRMFVIYLLGLHIRNKLKIQCIAC